MRSSRARPSANIAPAFIRLTQRRSSMHRWAPLLLLWAFGCASGVGVSEPVRDALTERFTLSRIEAPSVGGQSLSLGAKLILERDGMPAKPLRIIQPNPKLPRVHAGDYARVEVARD